MYEEYDEGREPAAHWVQPVPPRQRTNREALAGITGIHLRLPARHQQTLLALEENVECENPSNTFFQPSANSFLTLLPFLFLTP
jgi:hypothetical protein